MPVAVASCRLYCSSCIVKAGCLFSSCKLYWTVAYPMPWNTMVSEGCKELTGKVPSPSISEVAKSVNCFFKIKYTPKMGFWFSSVILIFISSLAGWA